MPLAPVKADALAEISTAALPSVSVLFGALMVNVAEVAPAAMVAVAGTVRREVVFEESETTSAVGSVPEIVTVPVVLALSLSVAGTVRARSVFSLSSTSMGDVSPVQPNTCALITALCVPSIFVSLTTLIGNVAVVCPAGITTPPGTCTTVMSLELKPTVIVTVDAALISIVPCTVPTPSVAEAGAVSVIVAVPSLSCTAVAPAPLA